MDPKTTGPSAFVPFLAGALAPFAVAAGLFALAGDSVLERIRSLGLVGTIIGLSVFVLTVVLPCALFGALGRSPGRVAAFGRGVLLPLGILAVAGVSHLDGTAAAPMPEPSMENVLAESFRVVWMPGVGVTAAPENETEVASTEDAPESDASLDVMLNLQDQVRDLGQERNRLRARLRDLEAGPRPEPAGPAPARSGRAKELETRLRTSESELAASRRLVARLEGQLRNVEKGLLDARREGDGKREAVLKAKEEAQIALGDAEFEKKELLAKIAALEDSEVRRELKELRSRAFVPIGVVFEIDRDSRGRGLAIRTGVDAARVKGPGIVVSPDGKVLAVLRCGMGKGEALGATILFLAPVAKVTPGDRVYAHVR